MVEDPYHIPRVGPEPVARLKFALVAPAPQVHADEGAGSPEVARQGAKCSVLGGDAVEADQGFLTTPGASDRQLDLPGHPVRTP